MLSSKIDLEVYTCYGENKCILLPKDEYIKPVGELLEATHEAKKSPRWLYFLKKYELLQCGDVQKLIRKKPNQEHPLYFATIEDTFDIIKRGDIATGHGGREKSIKEINMKYANITQDAVTLFKSMCIECQRKRKRTTTRGIVKPILSKDFSSRA